MSELFKSQSIGFKPSANYADDLIALSSTEWWKWGKYNSLWGNFPLDKRQLSTLVTGAKRTPQDIYFGKYMVGASINATVINAIPLYYALGKVTNTGASDPYTHVIEPQSVGVDLPDFMMRSEDYSSAQGIYESYLGNYIKNLVYSIDLTDRKALAAYGITTFGQQVATPQFAGVSTGLIAPGGIDDHFKYDSNIVVNWGGAFTNGVYSSGGTDIKETLKSIAITVDNDLIDDTPHGQDYPDNFLFGEQTLGLTFELLRKGANPKVVYDDFRTMVDGTTKKNLSFKLYQDATHYIQCDLENITLSDVIRPNTSNSPDQKPTYNPTGFAEDIKVTAVDALAGATYYA